jgi:hypothetical protein
MYERLRQSGAVLSAGVPAEIGSAQSLMLPNNQHDAELVRFICFDCLAACRDRPVRNTASGAGDAVDAVGCAAPVAGGNVF